MQEVADKGRLTVQQILETVLFLFAVTKSIVKMQLPICAHFGMQWTPSPKTICRHAAHVYN
jgi:hypothetical protein